MMPGSLYVETPKPKPEPVEVNPHSIIVAPELFQVRKKMRYDIVSNYASCYRNGVDMPPITLAELNGSLFLVDGFHRFKAYQQIGIPLPLKAYVIPVKSKEEARWLAYVDNNKNGLPLRKDEKEQGFHAYIAAKQYKLPDGTYKSSRQIAFDLGFWRHPTILKKMKEHYPRIYKKMTKDKNFDADQAYCLSEKPEYSVEKALLKSLDSIMAQVPALNEGEKKCLQDACMRLQILLQQDTGYVPSEEEDY